MALSPRPILDFYRERLRTCIVDEDFFTDTDLSNVFDRGYREACERSLCLRSIARLSFVAGETTVALPEHHYRTFSVWQGGVQLQRLSERNALLAVEPGYYETNGILGVFPTPAGGAVYLHYARTPEVLPEGDAFSVALDHGFPPEFYYLLWHYVRWRWYARAGGAGRISQARWERQKFDEGVLRLRRYARRLDLSARTRFVHVSEGRRSARSPLAPGVDAG